MRIANRGLLTGLGGSLNRLSLLKYYHRNYQHYDDNTLLNKGVKATSITEIRVVKVLGEYSVCRGLHG